MSVSQQRFDVEATPDDVAALLTARTKDAEGNELGIWTDETRPTYDQVQTRIDIARSLVGQALGDIPDVCLEGYESAVALRAALLTEAAFWPEQIQAGESTFAQLRELYAEAWAGVETCVAKATAGAGGVYELDIYPYRRPDWPPDWWQRNLERDLP